MITTEELRMEIVRQEQLDFPAVFDIVPRLAEKLRQLENMEREEFANQ